MEKNNSNRREFLKRAGLLFGAGVTATSLSSLIVACKDETIPLPPKGSYNISLNDYPELATVGTIARCDGIFNLDPAQKLTVLIRVLPDDKFVIVQSGCSHQADQALPTDVNGSVHTVCPRHSAAFSLNEADAGKLVDNPKGVPAGDLKVFTYEYKKAEKLIVIET